MKRNFGQAVMVIAILVLTIALLWLYLSVYRVYKKTEGLTLSPTEMRTLNPNLDTKVLEELKKRKI